MLRTWFFMLPLLLVLLVMLMLRLMLLEDPKRCKDFDEAMLGIVCRFMLPIMLPMAMVRLPPSCTSAQVGGGGGGQERCNQCGRADMRAAAAPLRVSSGCACGKGGGGQGMEMCVVRGCAIGAPLTLSCRSRAHSIYADTQDAHGTRNWGRGGAALPGACQAIRGSGNKGPRAELAGSDGGDSQSPCSLATSLLT